MHLFYKFVIYYWLYYEKINQVCLFTEDSQDTKSMSSSEEETENSQDAKDSDEDFKPVVKSFSHDGKQSGENSIRYHIYCL